MEAANRGYGISFAAVEKHIIAAEYAAGRKDDSSQIIPPTLRRIPLEQRAATLRTNDGRAVRVKEYGNDEILTRALRRRCGTNCMYEYEPALGHLYRRCPRAEPSKRSFVVGQPQYVVTSPVDKIGGLCHPDLRTTDGVRAVRPMQRPKHFANSSREQHNVFVFRRKDHAETFRCVEIVGPG